MKTHFKLSPINIASVLAIFLLCISSCSDKEELIGMWDDNIHLSTKNVDFQSETDSVTISTQGDWWWVESISFEDSIYTYHDNESIDLESEAYTINEDEFTIKRQDKNHLFVKMNSNHTSSERSMLITLEAGDYFDYVTVKQASN